MVKKYPEYVTTDSDFWNSADEAYFFVSKNEAKRLTDIITPIIENALETGMLREATQTEIDEYLLKEDVEKKVREGRIDSGKNWQETLDNYYEWKKNYDKPKLKPTEPIKSDSKGNKIDDKKELDEKLEDKKEEKEDSKPLTPTQNALNQKASVRSDNMN